MIIEAAEQVPALPMCDSRSIVVSILEAAEQGVPPSLTLPHKGGGNRDADASLTDASQAEDKP